MAPRQRLSSPIAQYAKVSNRLDGQLLSGRIAEPMRRCHRKLTRAGDCGTANLSRERCVHSLEMAGEPEGFGWQMLLSAVCQSNRTSHNLGERATVVVFSLRPRCINTNNKKGPRY